MTLLERLSSALGLKTQEANRAAAEACSREPQLLEDIAKGLTGDNASVIGDCAEVMTKVAELSPLLVVPFVSRLAPLLSHKTTRVRWEAAHAIALAAPYTPGSVFPLLRTLTRLVRDDSSTVVRDYAIDALCGYGTTDPDAGAIVLPPLRAALDEWGGKHRAHILEGLARIAPNVPASAAELMEIAHIYADNDNASIKKAAGSLNRAIR